MTAPVSAPREWTRLHWVTPVLGAGQGLVVVGALLAYQNQTIRQLQESVPEWIPVAAFVLIAAAISGLSALQWRMNHFRISDDAVEQRKGVLFRQQRQARLDRLQAVDVVQPLVARIFGFAELKVEVAGGKESGIKLQYLRLEHAEALRNEILALAAGRKVGTVDAASRATAGESAAVDVETLPADVVAEVSPFSRADQVAAVATQAAPEREVFKVPAGRLIGSVLLSWPIVILVSLPLLVGIALLLGATAGGFSLPDDLSLGEALGGGALGSAWGLIAAAAALWAQLNSGFNFTAGIAADGIRLKHGLLDTRRQTVPPGRVQALRLRQSLLWRKYDWWRVTINVAGYQDDQAAVSTLLPVGPRRDALYALWLVLPDLGDPDPAGTISAALTGKRGENGFTASPPRSWVYDLLQWRHRGVRATDRALIIRRGLFVREVFVVPHERTQSLAIRQGPLQRALRLATLAVHSTNGTVRPVAEHLDIDDARAIIEDQARRAREGRERQTPAQWMATVGAEG